MNKKRIQELLLNCVTYVDGFVGSDAAYDGLKKAVGFTDSELDAVTGVSDEDIDAKRSIELLTESVIYISELAGADTRKVLIDSVGFTADELDELNGSFKRKETKRERFCRLAENRVNKILHLVKLIGNLADESNYEYSEDQVERVFNAIQTGLNNAKARFAKQARFSLSDRANPEPESVSKERIIQILQTYVSTDAEAAEPEYIRDMLRDTCGMSPDEIKELGFDWLFPDEEGEEDV